MRSGGGLFPSNFRYERKIPTGKIQLLVSEVGTRFARQRSTAPLEKLNGPLGWKSAAADMMLLQKIP